MIRSALKNEKAMALSSESLALALAAAANLNEEFTFF
jgi:hypothetical protein